MVNFLAEISKRSATPVNPTPSNGNGAAAPHDINRRYNIYEIDTGAPPDDSYWLAWGGHNDLNFSERVEPYYGKFLMPVNSIGDLKKTPHSYYAANNLIYINIPVHPWIYGGYSVGIEDVYPFLSAPLNENDPTELTLIGKNAQVRLDVPSVTVKLSENISGVVLNQGFSLTLSNGDGYFDKDPPSFNAPVTVKKSVVNNPAYSDFKTIRRGLTDGARIDFSNIVIDASDFQRSMNEPVCDSVSRDTFYFQVDDGAVGKPIPVIYGVKKTGLIKLGNNRILAAEYAETTHLYDKDGNPIDCKWHNTDTGGPTFVTVFSEDDYKNADYAVVKGYANNRAGDIIVALISGKTQFSYRESFWNRPETELYRNDSPRLNIAFSDGDVSKAVNGALKSDMAYLVQQADGRLVIRKWGRTYKEHYLEPWMITREPSFDYSKACENYFSSCNISYANGEDNRTGDKLNYVFDENRNGAELRYRKLKERNFETDLVNVGDVEKLARLLSGRYTFLKPALKLAVGTGTGGFELLDTVYIKADINGRLFTEYEKYVITEIDQAQDTLTLEAVD